MKPGEWQGLHRLLGGGPVANAVVAHVLEDHVAEIVLVAARVLVGPLDREH